MSLYDGVAGVCFGGAVIGAGAVLYTSSNWQLALAIFIGSAMTGFVFQALHEIIENLQGIRDQLPKQAAKGSGG